MNENIIDSLEIGDSHHLAPVSAGQNLFLNTPDFFKSDKSTDAQFVFLCLMVFILVSIIIYVIYSTIDCVSFLIAAVFTIGVVILNPGITLQISNNPVIVYYSVFFMVTLLFSLEEIRNRDQILLVISLIFAGVLALYTLNRFIVFIAIFINIYVVIRILMVYIMKSD